MVQAYWGGGKVLYYTRNDFHGHHPKAPLSPIHNAMEIQWAKEVSIFLAKACCLFGALCKCNFPINAALTWRRAIKSATPTKKLLCID